MDPLFSSAEVLVACRNTPYDSAPSKTKTDWLVYGFIMMQAMNSQWKTMVTEQMLSHAFPSASDESFVLLLWESLAKEWKELAVEANEQQSGNEDGSGEKKKRAKRSKYFTTHNVKVKTRYNELTELVKEARMSEHAGDWELALKKHAQGIRAQKLLNSPPSSTRRRASAGGSAAGSTAKKRKKVLCILD